MLYDSQNDLEDLIVQGLVNNSLEIKELHKHIRAKDDKDVSLRAVYKSINQLLNSGVLLKVGKKVLLDNEWVERVRDGLLEEVPLLQLDERESVLYTFSSLSQIDSYWKTITNRLDIDSSYPIFFYNPHDIWVHLKDRQESEEHYYSSFEKNGVYGFYVVGGKTTCDRDLKQRYGSNHFQIHLEDISLFKRTDHITAYEKYVITVRLPKEYTEKIDSFYLNSESVEELTDKINQITPEGKIYFKVENSSQKARRLRKKLSKNFFIPQELREKCDLF